MNEDNKAGVIFAIICFSIIILCGNLFLFFWIVGDTPDGQGVDGIGKLYAIVAFFADIILVVLGAIKIKNVIETKQKNNVMTKQKKLINAINIKLSTLEIRKNHLDVFYKENHEADKLLCLFKCICDKGNYDFLNVAYSKRFDRLKILIEQDKELNLTFNTNEDVDKYYNEIKKQIKEYKDDIKNISGITECEDLKRFEVKYFYDEIRQKKKLKVAILIITIVSLIVFASISNKIYCEINYRNLIKTDIKNINTVLQFADRIGNYKDSKQIATDCIRKNTKGLKNNYIFIGHYNGVPIKWKIIDVNENQVFLCASNTLFDRQFDARNNYDLVWSGKSIRWNNSELRKHLNTEFYDVAFSESEKLVILETELKDVETTDKIYLLSKTEWQRYMNETMYDAWLRTSVYKYNKYFVCRVYSEWCDDYKGDEDNIGVQPAMKIDISKLSYLSGNGTYDSPIKFK